MSGPALARAHFEAMGTVVSLALPGEVPADAVASVREVFERHEQMFSLYRPGSEASRFARGELALADLSEAHRDVVRLALAWRERTAGAFTPYRPDGVLDLAGVVKALAIADAGDALARLDLSGWCLNAGGDVLTAGTREDGRPWVVGIVDPDDAGELLTQHTCSPGIPAVATSGTAERGEHVWRTPTAPVPAAAADPVFHQVSVAAPDIVTADVLATAILAGGRPTLDHVLARFPGIEVVAAHRDGLLATAGFRGVSPPSSDRIAGGTP